MARLANLQMLIRTTALLHILSRPPVIQRRAMSSFALNKDIFNPSLYKQVQNVWFEGHALGSQDISMDVVQRWFLAPPEEKLRFDKICRNNFAHALEAIGPEEFPNPSAEPFLDEIHESVQRNPTDDGADAAWTALSIIILLDQISRNIYRTNEGQRKIYTHYDKIAYSLVNTLMSPETPIVRPDLHPQWRLSLAHRQWFYMPLMHSEDLDAHKILDDIFAKFREDLGKEDGYESMKQFLERSMKSEKDHRDILEKFGRYPHRNGALGRESTDEERKFLAGGGATFGVAQEE